MTVTFYTSANYTSYRAEGENSTVARSIIDRLVSFRPNGYFFSKKFKQGIWDGYISLSTHEGFPTGLLPSVLEKLSEAEISYTIEDSLEPVNLPELPDKIKLYHKNLPNNEMFLRDYQYHAVEKSLEKRRGIVQAATNAGKTEIACGILKYVQPTLIDDIDENLIFFTHSIEIATQSRKRIEERLQRKVGFVGAGEWDLQDITVVMIPTLSRHLKPPNKQGIRYTKEMKAVKMVVEMASGAVLKRDTKNLQTMKTIVEVMESVTDESQYNPNAIDIATQIIQESQTSLDVYEKVKELKEALRAFESEKLGKSLEKHEAVMRLLENCRGFIADEAHHSSSTTWYDTFMLMENAEFRIGLTGTVDKNDDPLNLGRLRGATGDTIVEISNDFLIRNGYSAKPTIHLETIDKPNEVIAGSYREAYAEGIVENEYRNEVIARRVSDRVQNEKACLVIVNYTLHGELLEKRLKELGVECEFIHGSRTTEDRQGALDRLGRGELPVLIATTILDEGVDVSGINCVWMAGGGKSYKKVLQRVGRGLRKKEDGSGLEVYDFLDYTNNYLTKHTLERYDYYSAEKFDIVKTKRIV